MFARRLVRPSGDVKTGIAAGEEPALRAGLTCVERRSRRACPDSARRPSWRWMLSEVQQVKQEAGAGHRRWFEGDGLELIVWCSPDRAPVGFQLCYQGDDRHEHALTWQPALGFTHARVAGGGSRLDKNMTPILVEDGPVPWERVRRELAQHGAGLEPALRDYVLGAFKSGTG